MTKRRSSIGFLGIFGRSQDLRRFDEALRSVGVHPRLVAEAVKLTAVSLQKDHAIGPEPAPQSYREAAEMIGYCLLGATAFAQENDAVLVEQVERRIEAALDTDASMDAQLILLAMHAGIIQPSVTERFGLESAAE